jgi:hypothetical protein
MQGTRRGGEAEILLESRVVRVLRRSEWESRLTAVEQGVAWLIKNRMTRTLVLQQRGVFGA